MIDVNYIRTTKPELDRRIFFDNEDCIIIEPFQTTLAQLMAHAKIFPSTGEAKRNGWDKPIPKGLSQFVVGKMKKIITIFDEILD